MWFDFFFVVQDLHQMVENSMKIHHKKDYDHHNLIDDAAETKASWLKECRRRETERETVRCQQSSSTVYDTRWLVEAINLLPF